MLQGAAYHPGPLYGNSHYKKFWLKKMQTEESVREPDAFRAPPPESFGGVIFRKCLNDVNCSRLEIKGGSRASFGVPARRSESSQILMQSFEDERHSQGEKQIFDCALSIGVPALREREEDNFAPAVENSGTGMHKFKLHQQRLLRADSDLQTAGNISEKTTEAEFSDGSVTRTCSDCKTDKTPLWRNGPNGPKSLCNACGIRYKKITKQRSASNGDGGMRKNPAKLPSSVRQMTKFIKRKRDNTPELGSQDPAAPRKKSAADMTEAPPISALRGFSNDKQRSSNSLLKRSFGKDEEEGAVLLMGLSCGLVNA
ncbi:hypothetical protein SUGI_0783000 [Cryptomeria japonica]|uniref:GATA transcription factor 17 n=1 Tax=Cryptomeria japonica TaxID=3369 RepID=UPI002414B7E5|nr:GATA transcription factor 17 [Cryptomeria japonica]GLJ38451.1 hypothetical protein SUGI_0783000 [Cryptomeria japonica]